MARPPDIGGYFDQLTRRGRGGRRATGDQQTGDAGDNTTRSSDGSPSIRDRLRDAVDKGRDTVKRTADRARGGARPPAAKPADSTVTVEYTPAIDGDPDPGDVVWVWVPYEEDPTQGKDRPVVVIGRRGDVLVGIPLTTKQHDNEAQVEVGTGDWDPKRRPSYARIWRMLDIDPTEMRREGAVLERDRFDRIIAAVDHYYDVRRPPQATADDY